MEDDWDLHAVVRGCAAITTSAATAHPSAAVTNNTNSSQNFSTFQQGCNFSSSSLQDLFEPRRDSFVQKELNDPYMPFFPKSIDDSQRLFSLPISPLSVLGDLPSEQPQQQQQRIIKQLPQQTQLGQKQPSFSVSNVSKASVSQNPSPRSKRRKNHLKRVCHLAAENLSSDMWSWRKYGQKPIKGSPYPRGYYRCSTSKGCLARKQVERNRSDPGMFIVTYTAEHNHPMPTHRNSLAGSTRQKPAETPNSDDPSKLSCSPETSIAASLSPVPEKLESSKEDLVEADDDDEFSVSKMPLDDDFFAGLEDFPGPGLSDCTFGYSPANLQFPWLSSSATTIAGGG